MTLLSVKLCMLFTINSVSDALDVFVDILKSNVEGKVTEEFLLKAENIGKVYVCIDEMISDVS